ncbi:MAG: glutamine amidotransferase [Ruminococcaceae bacterium]|nr:glutamine amidotransferase [Oscillospiraceae bacterium]
MENKKLRIGHLYPELLNLYGDTGNILTLKNRLIWRNMEAEVEQIEKDSVIDFKNLDIVFLGGGSDREQLMVFNCLEKQKEELLEYVEAGGVFIAVCGGYQLLGKSYPIDGQKTKGLGILDMETEANDKRLIGNVVIRSDLLGEDELIVGFENHAGRTYLGHCEAFGTVLTGNGNNGEDMTCGAVYKNLLGTYLHGPLFPKNPVLADYFLQKALERKYGETTLVTLQDKAEQEAHNYAVKRFLNQ